jgi:hypothetical protein
MRKGNGKADENFKERNVVHEDPSAIGHLGGSGSYPMLLHGVAYLDFLKDPFLD